MYHIYTTRYCRLCLLQGWALYHTSQWTNNEANDDEVTDDINTEDEATIDVNAMVHCNPEADAKAR